MANHIKIYTRKLCGYCTAAEHLLKSKGVAFEKIDCTGDQDKRTWLAEITGHTTVPQVFIDDRSIGGYNDLRALDRTGELDKLLAGAPAPTS